MDIINSSIKVSAWVFTIAAILCLSTTTKAQESIDTLDTGQVYKLDEVIISASRFEESPMSVGRNVTVITREEIDRSVYSTIAGLLSDHQGIHAIGDRQTPGANQTAFLRNTNSNHYVVMIDGARISDPSTNNNGIDLSELSLAGVERIEIVRGSHSTLYGSSAVGGVINIITQTSRSSGVQANLNTQHGILDGNVYSTTNDLSARISSEGGLYANIGAFQQFTPGLDATVDTVSNSNAFSPGDRDRFGKFDLMGKVGYQTSKVDIYGSYRRVNQSAEVDQGAYADDNNAQIDFQRNLINYGGTYSISDNLALKFSGAWSETARDFVNDSSVVDAQGNFDGIFTETNGKGTLWENELTALFESDNVRFLIGSGSSRQTMTSRSYIFASAFDFESTTDLDSLDLTETITSVFVHTDLNGSILSENLENISLVLGSRLVSHNQFGTHITYELNPRLQISSTGLIYGSITTGFNAPSLYQLHSPDQGLGALTNRGNETLDPETAVSYELGWKQSLEGSVQLNVSLFKTKVSDVIEYIYLWNGDTAIENIGFADYRGDTYINAARQDVNGLELGLNVLAIPNFTIGGNLTYTRSSIEFSPEDFDEEYTGGNHVQIYESGVFVTDDEEVDGLSRRPNLSAEVKAQYRPSKRLSINLRSRFVGDRDDVFYSDGLGPLGALDRSRVGNYNLTDIGIRYRINRYVTTGAQIENVFNTDYTEINGYSTRGRGALVKASFSF